MGVSFISIQSKLEFVRLQRPGGIYLVITEQHLALCQQIIHRCRQQRWYGPDADRRPNPVAPGFYDRHGIWHESDESIFGYRGYFDEQGQLQQRAIMHDPRTGFEFPPATEKQLRDTERALGFPLPPMLRALYAHVANGGFGPAYGITGAIEGYYLGDDGHYQTLGMDIPPETFTGPLLEEEPINLAEYERQHGDPLSIDLPPNTWPDHFLQICYVGCGIDIYLDGVSGRVYRVESGYEEAEGLTLFLLRLDNSFEYWLESWLRGYSHL